jgi:hypothetical protein
MYTSTGILRSAGPSQKEGWFYLECDSEIASYYHWFYNRAGFHWKSCMNGVHITFLAGEKDERIVTLQEMKPFIGMELEFHYDNVVWTNSRAFWLPVLCSDLDRIRLSLGLAPRFLYHVTLGNNKYLEIKHE